MKTLAWLFTALLMLGTPLLAAENDPVLLIGHPGLPPIDADTVERLYTGRSIEVAGTPVTVVNAAGGSALRRRFLATWLRTTDERYGAYWTVRRHVGKGAPPRELGGGSAEMIDFVRATPGAIGYIDAAELRPGLNVIARP
ncbi:hypothetical protein [Derxia gummosa]|uniref:Phosphate ABC transporter substrate-binding protein n=1 Tax=Derxia gummosa DSM 723 TaxID=1121388 RepID=A0A8B6X6A9_9BURK|nr:hypothetical protein [Derxia gummosa]